MISPFFRDYLEFILSIKKELLLKLSEKELILPTVEEIIEINKTIMLEHRGNFGVRDAKLIDMAIVYVLHKKEYEQVNDIKKLGLILFEKLIHNRPFIDGNKRTAIVALDYFLLVN